MKNELIIGDRYEGVHLETIIGINSSRPRVRSVEYFDKEIRVEFPRHLREDNPIGTQFRSDVKVSQKTKDGEPWGKPYLVSKDSSIVKLDYTPKKSIQAIKLNTPSDRAYDYIEKEFKVEPNRIKFSVFRKTAYLNSIEKPESKQTNTSSIQRSHIIKTYALSRANGTCEACDNDAPFLKINGQPYLEVHHITELGKGGSDSPQNVAAICPNCHARVTHGQDAIKFNNELQSKIIKREEELDK